jgi:hypothetical protein
MQIDAELGVEREPKRSSNDKAAVVLASAAPEPGCQIEIADQAAKAAASIRRRQSRLAEHGMPRLDRCPAALSLLNHPSQLTFGACAALPEFTECSYIMKTEGGIIRPSRGRLFGGQNRVKTDRRARKLAISRSIAGRQAISCGRRQATHRPGGERLS